MARQALALVSLLCLCQLHAFVLKSEMKEKRRSTTLETHSQHAVKKRSLSDYAGLLQDDPRLGTRYSPLDEEEEFWRELLEPQGVDYGGEDLWPYQKGNEVEANDNLSDQATFDEEVEDTWRNAIEDEMREKEEEEEEERDRGTDGLIPVDASEIQNMLSTDEEGLDKKNVDWLPKAAGFGVSRDAIKRTEDEQRSLDEGDAVVKADGQVVQLSSDDVKELLSEPSKVHVNGVQESVHVENINGEEKTEAKTTYDITSRDDNSEHTIEVDQATNGNEVNMDPSDPEEEATEDEGITDQEIFQQILNSNFQNAPRRSKKHKRSESGLNYAALGLGTNEDAETDQEELAKRCLIKYLALEDAENQELAGALNWATLEQVNPNQNDDKAVGSEVDHLKAAIAIELDIQDLQKECAGLLRNAFQGTMAAELGAEGDGLDEDDEGYLPEENVADVEDVIEDEEQDDDGANDLDIPKQWLLSLQQYLDESEEQGSEEQFRQQTRQVQGPGSQEDDNGQWYLNPFLRDLVYKYAPDQEEEEERSRFAYPEPAEMCPVLDRLVDGCSVLAAAHVYMDDEALELCTRHQLCYTCGAAFQVQEESCDVMYFEEAHATCKPGDAECRDTSRRLFNMMQDTHRYMPHSPRACADPCVISTLANRSPFK